MKVRDLVRALKADGWALARVRGSHHHFTHASKPGTDERNLQAGRLEMTYKAIIERGQSSWGACFPDLPGCIAVAETRERVEQLVREAVEVHIELLRERGEPVPSPSAVATIDVDAA